MQSLEKINNNLQLLKEDLNKYYGIEKLAIFGSYAKGEQKEDSDLDIVIIKMKRKNGFLIVKARKFLSEKLNLKVDLGLYDSMQPFIKKRIQEDIVYV